MTCLDNAQIQAVADREAAEDTQQHVASCARCAERVRDREIATAALVATVSTSIELPPHVARRVEAALVNARTSGATRLRSDTTSPAWSTGRRTAWSAAVAVAATLIGVLFIAPLFRDPTVVSASEVLAASARRLSQSPTTGVELLEYELVIDGAPKEMMPDHANGTYSVWQAIDHDTPGRFRFASFDPAGRLISSIAQDPAQHRRVMLVTLDGQAYRFDVSLSEAATMSLPELQRLHMEASITMMQASGNQLLQIVETPGGRQYRIEVPQLGTPAASPVWDLTQARVVVDATDYHIVEFAVSGTFLKQPYSVSYKQIRHLIGASLPPGAFEVPAQPGQIELSGEGTAVPPRDAMVLALRELARLKQAR